MDESELHEAVNEALEALAVHLGGTTETGGPVENATQVKGRGELGVFLTDASGRVLGRVWLEFGAKAQAPNIKTIAVEDGSVGLHATVRSEQVHPPMTLEAWLERYA